MNNITEDDVSSVFDLFNSISRAEIERRIAWLEDALCRWRTILVIKELDERRPPNISLMKEPIVLTPERIKEAHGGAVRKVMDYMKERGFDGATQKEIERATGLSLPTVSQVLNRGSYVKTNDHPAVWRFKEILSVNGDGHAP